MAIRVLLVDDSAFFLEAFGGALAEDGDIEVCGTATDAKSIVSLVERTNPDVVSMDLHMPGIDGLAAIALVTTARKIPIVVMTGDPRGKDGSLCMQALARGAVDVVAKPDLTSDVQRLIVCERLKAAAKARLKPPSSSIPLPSTATPMPKKQEATAASSARATTVVGIASSTGGPGLLATVLSGLPKDVPAGFLLVQHLAPGFVAHLARWLSEVSYLRVAIAKDGDVLKQGELLIAPDHAQMSLGVDGRVRVDDKALEVGGHIPSGTVLLSSIGMARGVRAIGLILSGMGRDGVDGLARIKAAGGATAAQDAATAIVDGMPKAARDAGAAQDVLAVDDMARWLVRKIDLAERKR